MDCVPQGELIHECRFQAGGISSFRVTLLELFEARQSGPQQHRDGVSGVVPAQGHSVEHLGIWQCHIRRWSPEMTACQ